MFPAFVWALAIHFWPLIACAETNFTSYVWVWTQNEPSSLISWTEPLFSYTQMSWFVAAYCVMIFVLLIPITFFSFSAAPSRCFITHRLVPGQSRSGARLTFQCFLQLSAENQLRGVLLQCASGSVRLVVKHCVWRQMNEVNTSMSLTMKKLAIVNIVFLPLTTVLCVARWTQTFICFVLNIFVFAFFSVLFESLGFSQIVGLMGMNIRLPGMYFQDPSVGNYENDSYASFFAVLAILIALGVIILLILGRM